MREVKRLSLELGFAPDADPVKPGVCTDVLNMIPTQSGLRALTEPVPRYTTAPLVTTDEIVGYGYTRAPFAEVSYDFCGTRTALFQRNPYAASPAWEDASRFGGYTAGAAACWSFERFGDYMVAAAYPLEGLGSIKLQDAWLGVRGFQDASSAAPPCAVITTAERFLLAFNGRDGNTDSWSCSARDDHTDWTISPATLATKGRLVEPAGPITAAIPFGNDVLAFKERAMILGRFVPGDPEVWRWTKLPFAAGARGPRAVCKIDDARIAMLNADSCFVFDGSRATDVLDGRARAWYQGRRNANNVHKHAALYDARNNSVWFMFPGSGDTGFGVPTTYGLVVNLSTGAIGRIELYADIVAEMIDPERTSLRSVGFFDGATHIPYAFSATQFGTVIQQGSPGYAGSQETISLPYFVTGDIGDPYDLIAIDGVRPDLIYKPRGALSATLRSRDTRFVGTQTDVVGTAEDSAYERFSTRGNAHWHRVKVQTIDAPMEVAGVWIEGTGINGRRK